VNLLDGLRLRAGEELYSGHKNGFGGMGKKNKLAAHLFFSCHLKVDNMFGVFFLTHMFDRMLTITHGARRA
jgi:hypothetical protein